MVHLSQLLLLPLVCSLTITGATAQEIRCTREMDLTFVVDSSGSICNNQPVTTCDNWKSLLDFMHGLVSGMVIGENDVRVALVEFAHSIHTKWDLTTYRNKSALFNAIDTLHYTGGNTNTITALDYLSTVYSEQRGDRPAAKNIAILITDGKPNSAFGPIPLNEITAAVKRVTDRGIWLMAVGVTDSIDMMTLKELSSPPHVVNETIFVVENYLNLKKILGDMEIQTCRAVNVVPQCTSKLDLTFVVDSSGSICNDQPVTTCENWKSLPAFMHTLVDDMTIGTNDVRVAMIQFQTNARVRWNLTTVEKLDCNPFVIGTDAVQPKNEPRDLGLILDRDLSMTSHITGLVRASFAILRQLRHDSKSSLLKAIDTLHYSGGTTNTIAALGNLSYVFNLQNGDRPGVNNTAILITDGKPRNDYDLYSIDQIRAAVKRVIDQNIRILVLGVTDSIDKETLKELSSPPHTENETVFLAKDYQNLKQVLNQLQIKTCTL